MTYRKYQPFSMLQIAVSVMPFVIALAALSGTETLANEGVPPAVTHDGLHLVQESQVAVAWVKPDANFGIYTKLLLLKCHVAFEADWQKKHNARHTTTRRVTDKDMERIKEDVARTFLGVFVKELDEDSGYAVVDEPGSDVLLVRSAIIDLDVTAPDVGGATRTRTHVNSAGAATLFIELYDSVSGEILARAIDRKSERARGQLRWSDRITNSLEAKRVFRMWAVLLRERLDELHAKENWFPDSSERTKQPD